jgi:hypothetical protein
MAVGAVVKLIRVTEGIRLCEVRPPFHEQLVAWMKTSEALALLGMEVGVHVNMDPRHGHCCQGIGKLQ